VTASNLGTFGYARANKHDYLERFYNDLWDVLKQKLTATEQQRHVPFSDWKKLQLASRWAVQLEEALAWSSVLVCITSPAYITQEWCGEEIDSAEEQRLLSAALKVGIVREIAGGPLEKVTGTPGYLLASEDFVGRWHKLREWTEQDATGSVREL
jgi:hypothetical protein